jgi:hypothetical protein
LGVVEGQHNERAVDGDRLGTVVVVEHHPAAEPAHPGLTGLVKDRVGPDVGHAGGRLGFRGGIRPAEHVAQVPGRAAGEAGQAKKESQAAEQRQGITAGEKSSVWHRGDDRILRRKCPFSCPGVYTCAKERCDREYSLADNSPTPPLPHSSSPHSSTRALSRNRSPVDIPPGSPRWAAATGS